MRLLFALFLVGCCVSPVDDSVGLNQYFMRIENEDIGCVTDSECYQQCLDEGGSSEECEIEA